MPRTRYLIDGTVAFGQGENRLRMRIHLNGQARDVPRATSLAALVESLGLDVRKVAVERNLEIVPRSAYGATMLDEDDRLEIVNFVGGG